ncbi:MAG: tetratricopeptide repeat protein [Ignavibacterium sp.]|nr:tetratricopeptide repeat protein [Ignavibacterium sp.]
MKSLIIILLSLNFFSFAQSLDERIQTGIKQIYNIEFGQAEKTFRYILTDYPENPSGRFFLAMIDWWKILLDLDNESYDQMFYQKLEDVIFHCDQILKKDKKNVDALFFKGGAIGFRGRLRALRDSWLKAADDGREALPIVEYASKLDPKNQDVQLGFGIYNYYAAVIPEEFPYIKPLMIFFPKGDKEKGIAQLKNTAQNGKYAKYEAQYFLMTLFFNYEKNYLEAKKYADNLTTLFPKNPSFQRWLGRIYARLGDLKSADSVFSNYLQKADSNFYGFNFPYGLRESHYYVAVHLKNEQLLDSSKYHFQKCIDISNQIDKDEDSGFKINSTIYLAQIFEEQNDIQSSLEYYRKVLNMRNWNNSHQLAEINIKRLETRQ